MFKSAELNRTVTDIDFAAREPKLREELLEVQYDFLKAAQSPIIISINGFDGAGKGESVNLLNSWLDPRHVNTRAFSEPSEEEKQRPPLWRFWRDLPPKGKTGIFFDAWYSEIINQGINGKLKSARLLHKIDDIVQLEHLLVNEGAIIIKFWFHLSQEMQKKRLKKLSSNPLTAWRVTDTDWVHYKHYQKIKRMSEQVIRLSNTSFAPWTILESGDYNYRNLTMGEVILKTLQQHLLRVKAPLLHSQASDPSQLPEAQAFSPLAVQRRLSKNIYETKLANYQARLNALCRDPKFRKFSLVTVFEGMDAAGKGGCLRRLVAALDARYYQVIPIGPPSPEERLHPYLWRFWRNIPKFGHVTLFDRSWYGRVLVERVEDYCATEDWQRAYQEIQHFEEQLVRHNVIVVKFWLAISREEQLARFKEREATGYKHYKITPDDWRNRDKWDNYEIAFKDMIAHTHLTHAPWNIIPANDKYFARIRVLSTLCKRIEASL